MRNSLLESVARVAGLVFGGVFAGFVLTVLVLELSMRRLSASDYTQVRQSELAHLDTLATATLIPTILATVVLVSVSLKWANRGVGLASVALTLLVVVFVTTVVINLPINADQLDWSVDHPPAHWARDRDRWQIAHAVRTAAAVAAYVCLVFAAGTHRRRPADDEDRWHPQLTEATSGTPGR